jgi:hypothetical protein
MKQFFKKAFITGLTAVGATTSVIPPASAQPQECTPVSAHVLFSRQFNDAVDACYNTRYSQRAVDNCIDQAREDYNTKMYYNGDKYYCDPIYSAPAPVMPQAPRRIEQPRIEQQPQRQHEVTPGEVIGGLIIGAIILDAITDNDRHRDRHDRYDRRPREHQRPLPPPPPRFPRHHNR